MARSSKFISLTNNPIRIHRYPAPSTPESKLSLNLDLNPATRPFLSSLESARQMFSEKIARSLINDVELEFEQDDGSVVTVAPATKWITECHAPGGEFSIIVGVEERQIQEILQESKYNSINRAGPREAEDWVSDLTILRPPLITPWRYYSNAISVELAGLLDRELRGVFGVNRPREQSHPHFLFFSEPAGRAYTYFKEQVYGLPFPASFKQLLAEYNITRFNAAFVNFYQHGQQHVTRHRDKTHANAPIISLSLYEDGDYVQESDLRSLCIAPTMHADECVSVTMGHRSVVIMFPGMQERFVHWVPPTSSVTYRFNITFRMQA